MSTTTKSKTMLMTVLDETGHEYRGTAAAIVNQMHAMSFAPSRNDEIWMMEVADRAFTQTGHDIDASNPESFIAGMLEAGLLKPKKD